MTTLTSVRSKIVAVVPEIMELKFGCRVVERLSRQPYTVLSRVIGAKSELYNVSYVTSGVTHESPLLSHEIIGRPITLEDVLRAIQRHVQTVNGDATDKYIFEEDGTEQPFWKGYYERYGLRLIREWRLGVPLDQQPESTIAFLDSILPPISNTK